MNPEASTDSAPGAVPGGPRTLARDAVILMYHHCAAPPADAVVRGLYVTPEHFAWQMDWLQKRNVEWRTFAELERPAAGGRPRVLVTFDDGYRDVYENAWPVLARRGIPAVVFPVVGDIGKSAVVWPENADRRPQSLMSAEQIREMAAGGVEFGSHLWEHRRADRLAPDELREQLARSFNALAEITGRRTLSLAYPYGDYSPRVVAETERTGYRYAVTTREGTNRNAPLLELRRYAIRGTRFHHRYAFTRTLRRALAAASQT